MAFDPIGSEILVGLAQQLRARVSEHTATLAAAPRIWAGAVLYSATATAFPPGWFTAPPFVAFVGSHDSTVTLTGVTVDGFTVIDAYPTQTCFFIAVQSLEES